MSLIVQHQIIEEPSGAVISTHPEYAAAVAELDRMVRVGAAVEGQQFSIRFVVAEVREFSQ
jgi:hypothetical protein